MPTMRYADFTHRLAGEGASAWDLHVEAITQKRGGRDVIVLSIGDPEFNSPQAVIDAAVAGLQSGDTHYADVVGLPRTRAAVAAQHSRLTGQQVGTGNVAIVAGAQGGLFAAAMCLLGPGDEAIVLEPMYVTYEATVQAAGARLVKVPLAAETGFRLDPAALEKAITPRTRAIFYATPNNPTGAVLSRAELEVIAALARRHDLWVVADEVYSTIVFDGEHVSICGLAGMAERTVTINSLSKSHAMTGWRAGWLVGPEELIHHVGNLGLVNLYGLPPFIQNAQALALETHIPEVTMMCEAYRRRRDLVLKELDQLPGIVCRKPAAGMFMLADVRGTGLTAHDFAWRLFRETGVAVLDATAFGRAAAGHLRISFALDEATLGEACRRIAAFAKGLEKAA